MRVKKDLMKMAKNARHGTVNADMVKLEGRIIEVEEYSHPIYDYRGGGWSWKKEWLESYDFSHISTDTLVRERQDNLMGITCVNLSCFSGFCPFDKTDLCDTSTEADEERIKLVKEELERRETMEWKPVRGERVLIGDSENDIKEEAIFLAKIEGAKYPVIVVDGYYEEEFENGEEFDIDMFKCIKQIPKKTELTLQEIADKFGMAVSDIRIKDA
jgi:hypothetical protein